MTRFKGKSVLILGSGGLRIGQAGEFDYSGTQAIKALKEEKIRTILINPNIATVQTDHKMADEVYLLPLKTDIVTKIIQQEKPDGILLGFGGQTALNLGLALGKQNVFEKENVQVLGTPLSSIRLTEDRELFKKSLLSVGILSPKSIAVSSVQEALAASTEIGFPLMIRSGFSLGGLGSGKINNEQELETRAKEALNGSPQLLIEEYLCGWKELEYEIVRDSAGNKLTICNMENMDPMGIHTGESIVVAPSLTLSNRDYHALREIALRAAELFNIVGECNIQFAFNPKNGDYRVIEMNARLSRSSALASKATGYPLAFVAAKLALGLKLCEIKNTVTKKTVAFFEPALDYVVVKIPRWDTQKLRFADRHIGTEMKSVGEVMAIGRSFPEALQKAVRMLNIGASGLTDYPYPIENPESEIAHATDRRLFALYQFFYEKGKLETAFQLSHISPWFLAFVEDIAKMALLLKKKDLTPELLKEAKQKGFSDLAIAKLKKISEEKVRTLRKKQNIIPWIKQIDTLAGEFDAETNYLYLTYHGQSHDIMPSSKKSVIVIGSGPYSIGSSVEFDWCAVNTCRTLRREQIETILINSNPETVSTDYDESDRLYFEELTLERIRDIADFENLPSMIISVGGQIANNLSNSLASYGYSLLGTSAKSIDQAENRQKFSSLLNKLQIHQPPWEKVNTLSNVKQFAAKKGFPLIIRPSYVLSGAAMNIVHSEEELEQFLNEAIQISPDHPVVMSQFISDAKELEIDGIAQNGEIIIEAMTEHIENAGVHSGDATLVLPPQRLTLETIRRTKQITKKIVKALEITGPFNIQFIAKNNHIQVIECNVRSSRSFPFVSKVTGHNFIDIATRVMLNQYQKEAFETLELNYVGVKSPQFSYNQLKGSDPVAHVEMASTGEVACLGNDLLEAFFLSWMSTEQSIKGKKIFVSIGDDKKVKFLDALRSLEEKGWDIYATKGTQAFLSNHGIASRCVYKTSEKLEPNVRTLLSNRSVHLIINIPKTSKANDDPDGFTIRRLSIDHRIPLITNTQLALVLLQCLVEVNVKKVPLLPLRKYRAYL
ncbi:MAG TPA: carbamoyl-phosphate synthase (glutamine-hydrolyzing) large subunit [Rhabdochlamydiaceae bacterium]|nr:carbamoyl-phosphate synthase (glutamine-hydrolyzing) large subunit [Rhabdochlamydiaceae bacterium]